MGAGPHLSAAATPTCAGCVCRYGSPLTLDWKDFCFSVNHPILTSALPLTLPNGDPVSLGTGDDWKPCINPSPLDAFKEQAWEFEVSPVRFRTSAARRCDPPPLGDANLRLSRSNLRLGDSRSASLRSSHRLLPPLLSPPLTLHTPCTLALRRGQSSTTRSKRRHHLPRSMAWRISLASFPPTTAARPTTHTPTRACLT